MSATTGLELDQSPSSRAACLALLDHEDLALLGAGPEHGDAERGDVVALQVDGTEPDGYRASSIWAARQAEIRPPTRVTWDLQASTRLAALPGEDGALVHPLLQHASGARTRWSTTGRRRPLGRLTGCRITGSSTPSGSTP